METERKQIVMVVDDSLMICQQIKAALRDTDIFLCEAHTGAEALDMIEQYQPDLILLDVVLPDTDGYQLFDKLKMRDQNNASIVYLTSKDKDDDVVKGFTLGACDYIKKPFVKGELQSRVVAHLKMKCQKDDLNRMNTELKTTMSKLNELAFKDGLTGLYNRRYVVGDLLDDIKGSRVEEKKNVVILCDIDDFKKVNDTYGHDAGDAALVCIANIIPFSLLILGGRHVDIQAVFTGADAEAVNLETVPNRHIGVSQQVPHRGNRAHSYIQLQAFTRLCLRLHGFVVCLTHIEKSSFLLKYRLVTR